MGVAFLLHAVQNSAHGPFPVAADVPGGGWAALVSVVLARRET